MGEMDVAGNSKMAHDDRDDDDDNNVRQHHFYSVLADIFDAQNFRSEYKNKHEDKIVYFGSIKWFFTFGF